MYAFNPDEIRSMHEERVGFLKSLFAQSEKEEKAPSNKPSVWDLKWLKRENRNK